MFLASVVVGIVFNCFSFIDDELCFSIDCMVISLDFNLYFSIRSISELQEKNHQLLESLRDLSKVREDDEISACDKRSCALSHCDANT